ncbi:MAG TPA: PBP1A family penicillin-binding protein [Myxococcales bacterium]|nr:PBP1A family penicillin-binding protein [Myxococcales bacterium]
MRASLKGWLKAGLVAALLVLAGGGGALWWTCRDLPRFDSLLDYEPKEATHLYTVDGQAVGAFFHEDRTVVPFDRIPQMVKQAVISSEDKDFYTRVGGVSFTGILRGFLKHYVFHGRLEGGSTITAQVVKTFLLSPERTIRRKIREAVLAERISTHLSRDEILYLYLNQVCFGHDRYGVEEASRYYFGKHVWEVDLGQAAILAGMVQRPEAYSPLHHPDAAKRRQLYVLQRLREDGAITVAQEKEWAAKPIETKVPETPPGGYYAEDVRRYLEARYGAQRVYEGGLQVTVGMDPALQKAAEAAVAVGLAGIEAREHYRGAAPEAAFAAIDPADRRVLALVGGSDFKKTPFDRATQAKRQPGSAFKPFVYTTAIDSQKFSAASVVLDTPVVVRDPVTGKEWKPKNDEGDVFDGPITLRQALARSKNTISVKLTEALTPEAVAAMAHRMGIVSKLPDDSETIALGTGEVSLLELVNGYTTIAAGGQVAEPRMVLAVKDRTGKVLEQDDYAPRPAVRPEVAFVVTTLMQAVIDDPRGTGYRAHELPGPLAGKTGTPSDFRDAWFSGFSSSLVAGAWIGFDDHRPLGRGEEGAHAALPIWMAFMQKALVLRPPGAFTVPPGVVFAKIDEASGKLAPPNDPAAVDDPFVPGTQPVAVATPVGENHGKDLFLRGDSTGPL